MPIYAYQCNGCGHQMDVLQKISDPAPKCPECGQSSMAKQITAAAFELKGNGWYKTDFASGGCPAAESSGLADLPPCAMSGACGCKAAG